jgi:hypothetical protein
VVAQTVFLRKYRQDVPVSGRGSTLAEALLVFARSRSPFYGQHEAIESSLSEFGREAPILKLMRFSFHERSGLRFSSLRYQVFLHALQQGILDFVTNQSRRTAHGIEMYYGID